MSNLGHIIKEEWKLKAIDFIPLGIGLMRYMNRLQDNNISYFDSRTLPKQHLLIGYNFVMCIGLVFATAGIINYLSK